MIMITAAVFLVIIAVFGTVLSANDKTIALAIAKEKTIMEIQNSGENIYIESITLEEDSMARAAGIIITIKTNLETFSFYTAGLESAVVDATNYDSVRVRFE